jgi:hypothetical protein
MKLCIKLVINSSLQIEEMSAKINAFAALTVTLSRGFRLVTIVKHNVGDASFVRVSSHALQNTHYVVSEHLK